MRYEQLAQLAARHNFSNEIQHSVDGRLIEVELTNGKIGLDITFPKINNEFYAYSLSSHGLPREVYPDSLRSGFTEEARDREIQLTVDALLGKKIAFYPKPGIFNHKKGYILLSIDGKEFKIQQKSNYFELPIAPNQALSS